MNVKLVDKLSFMRLPSPPPSDEELNALLAEPSTKDKLEELKPYLEIVNTDYLHWNDILPRFKPQLVRKDLRLVWCYTNLTRQFNARSIEMGRLRLRYVQTPQIEKTLHDLDIKLGGRIELEEQIPSPELKKKYLVNSLMEEAIASSQLEGAVTTRTVAKEMLRKNRKPRNESEQMIHNNYFTMKSIKEYVGAKEKLDLETIKKIHKTITKDTLKDKKFEGEFRTNNEVKVYSIEDNTLLHTPPDYKEVEELLQKVCAFANTESPDYYLHPLVKAIVLHYMIGYVHPFEDGNGRTARAIFYWYAMSQRYDYLEYIAISTAIKNAPVKYTMAYLYSESDHDDVTYFVKFNLRTLNIAFDMFNRYIEKTKTENRKIIEALKHDRKLNFRQADVIIIMSKSSKHITIEEMQERYHITYQTARTDLLTLVDLGYMNKILAGKQFLFTFNKEKYLETMQE